MGFVEERTAIENKFLAWSATPIRWPNKAFQQPASAFIGVYIQNGESRAVTLDDTMLSHRGVVIVQIFDKENNGEVNIRTLADQVKSLFTGFNNELSISGTEQIHFFSPSLSALSITNGWAQRNVTVPFEREEG